MIQLSIMIPAVFERGYSNIYEQLLQQIHGNEVELLVLFDNRQRSLGRKRQILLDAAQGKFITTLDDDDGVAGDYIVSVLAAIHEHPESDVIVFNSRSSLNGEDPFIVRTGIEYDNEQCHKGPDNNRWQDIKRKPWHWCVWSARLAKKAAFPDGYIDEDWYWLRQMIPHVKVQTRIDKVLHIYQYNSKTSLAQQGKPTT